MAESIERGADGLPVATEKELAAMERLFASEKYQIKEPSTLLRPGKKALIRPDFVMYTLDGFFRHVHGFVSAARRMIPSSAEQSFFAVLRKQSPAAEGVFKAALAVDIKGLNEMLNRLQDFARNVSVAALQPFVRALYRPLIRIYYLSPDYASSCLTLAYRVVKEKYAPSDTERLRKDAMAAVQELKYIYEKIFPAMYPLVLRMASPVMLSERDLFYKNGSKVLAWLEVKPDEIIFPAKESSAGATAASSAGNNAEDEEPQAPEDVMEGLSALEKLFPEAGWKKMLVYPQEKVDFAPYFSRVLQLPDTFVQLNPEHPLHFTMIVFMILAELFQGLRHVEFRESESEDGIYSILDDWIMYRVSIFEKIFGADLRAYTHQVYSQADFAKTPYAARLMANMFSTIRQYFLPFYDMRFHPLQKTAADRLSPLYPRVARLVKMLKSAARPSEAEGEDSVEALNPREFYRFDIPSPVSRHLDALCDARGPRRRTNEALIKWCKSILCVLDWWINKKDSPAYKAHPALIYRTAEDESLVPAFGVTARTDTEEIFKTSLRRSPLS